MEEWKIIDEFPKYSISNKGRVMRNETGYIKKNTLSKTGYYVVGFSDNGKTRVRLVHRLIANAFIEVDDPMKDCVNHIDGDKTNNSILNLEWVTKAENNRHAIEIGLYNANKPIFSENVETGEIEFYFSAREAERKTGVDYRQISDTCLGKQKTAHGFRWGFIKNT